MTITAKIIADSVGPNTARLTTFELRYPRFIHAEFMTHRQFSRNASSSRAIPVERQIQSIIEDTAMPMHWGKNQPGMQADEETDAAILLRRGHSHITKSPEAAWLEARDQAIEIAEAFHAAGYHKQVVNRLLEPFSHIHVVMTTAYTANWFGLRYHPDAQPEIRMLAEAMYEVYEESDPAFVDIGDWHLPYVTEADRNHVYFTQGQDNNVIEDSITMEELIKVSVARCARVSYKTHDGQDPSLEKDLKLYDRLVGSEPLHASPAEHQATPDTMTLDETGRPVWGHPEMAGNFGGGNGWMQYRKMLPNECIKHFEPPK